MITPDLVATAVVAKLNTNKVSLAIKDAEEISEDTASKLRPPWCGVFCDFDQESLNSSADDVQFEVPCEVKILCSSSDNKTAALSFAESFILANKVILLMKGVLAVESNEITLLLRKKPFEIIRNAADQCVLQVNMYYHLDAVGA